MQYGFHQDFIRSGDLRMFLAMSPDEEVRKLFDIERAKDTLIQMHEEEHNVLSYDNVAREAGVAFTAKLKQVPVLINSEGMPVHLAGLWGQQTCVIAGSGPSLDTEFVQGMQDHDAVVIAVGNAIQDIRPDIWVGSQHPPAYVMRAYQAPTWLSVSPTRYAHETLWNAQAEEFTEQTPLGCPANLFFNRSDYTTFLESPGISDCGTGSSFMTAITTAVCLGFSNIVLSGIDLGGSADNYFYFEEVPHKDTLERKAKAYGRVREVFAELNKMLLSKAIRVVDTKESGLGITVIPGKHLKTFISSAAKIQTVVSPGVSAPPDVKKAQAVKTKDRRKALVTAPHLWDNLEALTKELPVFAGPTANKVREKMNAALAKKGGCTGCAKRKLSSPLMRLFVEEYQKDSDNLEDVWERVLPKQYILKVGKDLITRSDHA